MSNIIQSDENDNAVLYGALTSRHLDQMLRPLKAMSNPIRLKILIIISRNKVCVKDIISSVGSTQSYISRHLRILRDLDIVTAEREGGRTFYRIINPAIAEALENKDEGVCRLFK